MGNSHSAEPPTGENKEVVGAWCSRDQRVRFKMRGDGFFDYEEELIDKTRSYYGRGAFGWQDQSGVRTDDGEEAAPYSSFTSFIDCCCCCGCTSEYTIEEPPLQKEDGHFVMTMNGTLMHKFTTKFDGDIHKYVSSGKEVDISDENDAPVQKGVFENYSDSEKSTSGGEEEAKKEKPETNSGGHAASAEEERRDIHNELETTHSAKEKEAMKGDESDNERAGSDNKETEDENSESEKESEAESSDTSAKESEIQNEGTEEKGEDDGEKKKEEMSAEMSESESSEESEDDADDDSSNNENEY